MKYIKFVEGTKSTILAMDKIANIKIEEIASGLDSQTLKYNIYKFVLNDGSIYQWQCSDAMSHDFFTWLGSTLLSNIFIANLG